MTTPLYYYLLKANAIFQIAASVVLDIVYVMGIVGNLNEDHIMLYY